MSHRAPTAVETDFHERMHAAHMYGLWELASQMTRHPEPKAIPYMWRSSRLEALVRESGEVVPVGEERRALQLFNPGLEGRWATTSTMIAAVQLLLPGETARAHRHTLTLPSWALHEHANLSTRDPAVLFSIQDRPVLEALGLYREEALSDNGGHQPVTSDFSG